ncbi:MAG: hypothetical protein QOC61_1402 [Acidobacteriota bacterium]|jgi:hypothetical protein|nr:hypothetical protein [Acidobacteriota bacterium]MDT7778209.1 hypothetical protein [Acidobacteriota bacterium]
MSLKFIRRLAVFIGAFCIIGETIRRWHTWQEWPPNFFDDYLIGAFLFYGAWRSSRDERRGHPYLAAAWAFACGLGYASFFGHLQQAMFDPNRADPAPIPHVWLTALIGAGWLLSVAALLFTLRQKPDHAKGERGW